VKKYGDYWQITWQTKRRTMWLHVGRMPPSSLAVTAMCQQEDVTCANYWRGGCNNFNCFRREFSTEPCHGTRI